MQKHTYEVISDWFGKQTVELSVAEVEQIRRFYHGAVSVTRVDNLDHEAIAKELDLQDGE